MAFIIKFFKITWTVLAETIKVCLENKVEIVYT